MQSIDGTISRIVYHKASRFTGNMFLIARLTDGTSVKGEMSRPVVGEPYRFFGEYRPQKQGYGEAFEFQAFEALCDQSTGGMVDYLAAHIEGVGRVKAAALVDHFGVETLAVLRTDPARALEVDGITETIVAAIRAHFDDATALDPVAYSRLIEMFAPYRIGKRIVERLVRTFGSSAPDRVLQNPYLLLGYPRTGWKTVDSFALSAAGYAPEGRDRHKAAILECLERIASDGHTCATESEILAAADGLLGMILDRSIIAELIEEGAVVEYRDEYGPIYQLDEYAEAERTIAEKLAVLMAAGRPLAEGVITDDWMAGAGIGGDQERAARMMAEHGVVILAGPPGTGKSWLLSRFLGRLKDSGIHGVRVMAPTGKAAKRAAELMAQVEACRAIPSTTIHKALAPSPNVQGDKVAAADAKFGRGREEFSFGKDEAHPFDESVIVVDETSMVDCKLMASLLRAVKPGTRLILVGDWNQLPSVGAGSVLRDIRGLVPTAELTEIRRSDGGGTVVRACHAIKDGRVPNDATAIDLPTDNWVHIELSDPRAIAEKIVELHAITKRYDPLWDMQVVSAQKAKHAFGCDNLNRLLAVELNPNANDFPGTAEGQDAEGGPPFRTGDKVVRTKNGLVDELIRRADLNEDGGRADFYWHGEEWATREIPLVNGDMGQVRDIILDGKPSVIVRFRDPDRLVRLPFADCHIIPAYAMTVHKMQGSGAKYVIVPVHRNFYPGLFTRELLYTAISRTEEVLVTVGEWSAIEAAVGRKSIQKRKTTLARRLNEAIEARGNLRAIEESRTEIDAMEADTDEFDAILAHTLATR